MRFFKISGVKDFQQILDEADIRNFVDELITITEHECFREDVRYFHKAERCLLESLLIYIRNKPEYMDGSPMDALSSLLEEMIPESYFTTSPDHFVEDEIKEIARKTNGKHPAVLKYRMYKNAAGNYEGEVAASCYERVRQIVPDTSSGALSDCASSEFSEFFIMDKPVYDTEAIQIKMD